MNDERLFRRARKITSKDRVEPTEAEARNGWTADTLSDYIADSRAVAAVRIDMKSNLRKNHPQFVNSLYSPFMWKV